MDEVAGADAVGGNKDFGMEARAEQVDGDQRRATGDAIFIERLANQHLAALEGGMAMTANGAADDLGGDHGGRVIGYRL